MPDVTFNIEVTAREFDQILAGLRMLASLHPAVPYRTVVLSDFHKIAQEHGPIFTPEEIGAFCQFLNGGPRCVGEETVYCEIGGIPEDEEAVPVYIERLFPQD